MTREEQIIEVTKDMVSPYKKCFIEGVEWADSHLNHWHDAQGDDLPEIDREVIVLLDNGKVCFAHRPPYSYAGMNSNGDIEYYYPKHYDKGEWNIPSIKWWCDINLPKGGGEE